MSNALNLRLINRVTEIAQGDNASTINLELLDNNQLTMPFLDGKIADIYFIGSDNQIKYQTTAPVSNSDVEFNIDSVIEPGSYYVEIHVSYDDSNYVFPSSVDYSIKVNKSKNHFYNIAIDVNGLDLVVREVIDIFNENSGDIMNHVTNFDNPHKVTKDQVGLSNVDNVKQATKTEFDQHANNGTIHVAAADKTRWNAKADKSALDTHTGDGNIHVTAADKTNWTGKVDKATLDNHVNNNDVHVTTADKTDWNSKATAADITAAVNDITADTVGLGNVANLGIATQAEAEAGLSDGVYMTPAKTKQAIDALGGSGGGGGGINLLKGEFDVLVDCQDYGNRISTIPDFGASIHVVLMNNVAIAESAILLSISDDFKFTNTVDMIITINPETPEMEENIYKVYPTITVGGEMRFMVPVEVPENSLITIIGVFN